ncbi:uncharacterized protein LOC120545258 [Perca fluviatilis]|uniref:uncharacterized protein LOC120545258 n=1 Tax=Perca fluviatilis TaxID=8168 RepID=UPI001965B4BF|nr:uncharacterized protein LOC120545258 [Perca fluviatilis]
MASTPRRGRSQDLPPPPDHSELMNKPKELAASFIREFDNREPKMRQIVGEFREISDEVRKMQERTDKVRKAGAGALGVTALGMLLGVAAGRAESAALTVAAGATGSAILVAGANVTKGISESESVNKVAELGKVFMEIVERLKKHLEEIKRMCAELEETSAELQAEISLKDMEVFQLTLRRVSILGRSDGVMSMWNVVTPTATPEKDRKLTDSIIKSADCCQEVVDDLKKMKEELKDFTEK